jgi:hypothetical protein
VVVSKRFGTLVWPPIPPFELSNDIANAEESITNRRPFLNQHTMTGGHAQMLAYFCNNTDIHDLGECCAIFFLIQDKPLEVRQELWWYNGLVIAAGLYALRVGKPGFDIGK